MSCSTNQEPGKAIGNLWKITWENGQNCTICIFGEGIRMQYDFPGPGGPEKMKHQGKERVQLRG